MSDLFFPEILLPQCVSGDASWAAFKDRLEAISSRMRRGGGPSSEPVSPTSELKKFTTECEICQEAEATIYCGQDKAHLCSHCDSEHHASTKLLMKHTRYPLYHSPFQFGYCSEHKADRYECVCLECGVMLCQLCLLVGSHAELNGHPIISTMELFRLSLTAPGGDFAIINSSNLLSSAYFAVDREKTAMIELLKLKHSLVVQAESNHWHIQQLLDRELRSVLEALDMLKKKRVDYLTGLRRESLLILTLLEWFEAFLVHARLALPASLWLAFFHRARLDFTKQLLVGSPDGGHITKVESVGDFVRLLPKWLMRRINIEGILEVFTDFLNPNRLTNGDSKMTASTFEWVPSPLTGVDFDSGPVDAEELRKSRMAARIDELITLPQGAEDTDSVAPKIAFPSSLNTEPVPLNNIKDFVMQTLAVLSHTEANLPELNFLLSKLPPDVHQSSSEMGLPKPSSSSAMDTARGTVVQTSSRNEEERLRQILEGGASPYANAVSVIFNAPSSERQELIRLFAFLFSTFPGMATSATALEDLIRAICRISVETIESSAFLVSGISMFVPLTACFTLSLFPKEAFFIDSELKKVIARVLPDRGTNTETVAQTAVSQLVASLSTPSTGIVFPPGLKFLLKSVYDECLHRFNGTVAIGVTSGLFLARVVSPRLLWTAPRSGGETQAPQVITMMARQIHRIAGAAAEGHSILQRTDDPDLTAVNACVSQTNNLIMRAVVGSDQLEAHLPPLPAGLSPRSAATKIERKLREYGQGIVY